MLTLWWDVQARQQALRAEVARERLAASVSKPWFPTLRVVLARCLRDLANRLDGRPATFEPSELLFADRRSPAHGLR